MTDGGIARPARPPYRRPARRRTLVAYGLPAMILAAVAGLAIALTGRTGPGDRPATTADVRIEGAPQDAGLAVGQPVPNFSAPALTGGRIAWEEFRGAPVALVVWASWCPHCQRELPIFGRVAPDFPSIRVVTVTTAIGRHPGPSPREFMRERGLSFPVAVDDARERLTAALGVRSFPTVYWVSRSGTVFRVTRGETDEATIRANFRSLAEAPE